MSGRHLSDRRVRGSANETSTSSDGEWTKVVISPPINLDGHRIVDGKIGSKVLLKALNRDTTPDVHLNVADIDIDAALLVQATRTWIEAMEKAAFLTERFAATKDADNPRIQKLIKHGEGKMVRLRKREETHS